MGRLGRERRRQSPAGLGRRRCVVDVAVPIMIDSAKDIHHIRPYPLEYTGSRPLSPSQTSEGRTSTQVGDHWGILGVQETAMILVKASYPGIFKFAGHTRGVLINDNYVAKQNVKWPTESVFWWQDGSTLSSDVREPSSTQGRPDGRQRTHAEKCAAVGDGAGTPVALSAVSGTRMLILHVILALHFDCPPQEHTSSVLHYKSWANGKAYS
ncbi:hypothetical protein M0657_010307 [Pyricularia oryzae]|nr:hypothetical protein M0657_010307 [Pyricularia oryzae]